MSGQHIFLSDVHFGGFDEQTNCAIECDLISLIDYCMDNRIRLHILGDLFDYWMEYPGHHPGLGTAVLDKFRMYIKQTGPVTFITGNHDNWTRGYFRDTGFDVEPECKQIRVENRSVFLHHGDGLTETRFGLSRPLFHRILRSPLFVTLYQKLFPPAQGLRLMKWFSACRRSRPVCSPRRLSDWSKEFLGKNDVDFVICGHDHIPRIETFPHGTYINSGAFCLHRTLVHYTNGRFQLVTWNSDRRQTVPVNDLTVLTGHE